MTAAAQSIFEERADPGRVLSALLAAVMHAVLFLVLLFGVRWQNRPPEAVQVELWNEPVAVAVPVPEEPKPIPKVEPAPLPVVKPEPVIPKPEIVEKKTLPPKPVAKAEPKVEPKPAPKPVPVKPVAKAEPLKPRVDETKRFQEEAAREQALMAVDRERQHIRDQLAKDASAATAKALATWVSKIQTHIRSRINKDIAEAVPGNPSSVFVVTLLPNCEVLKITLQKSSGTKAYDDEVERAILRASPLPRPDKAEVFDRELRLTFRPKDKDI
jgi:colicin import membrane protein